MNRIAQAVVYLAALLALLAAAVGGLLDELDRDRVDEDTTNGEREPHPNEAERTP